MSAFRFGLEMSSYSVLESDEVVTVCVTADRGDGSEVYTLSLTSINVTTQGMSMLLYIECLFQVYFSHLVVDEVDHGTLDQQMTVSADTYRQCVNVTISNDTVLEENEIFQISISFISRITGSTYIYQQYYVSATVTIIDDDRKYIHIVVSVISLCYNCSNLQSRVCEWSVLISWSLPM